MRISSNLLFQAFLRPHVFYIFWGITFTWEFAISTAKYQLSQSTCHQAQRTQHFWLKIPGHAVGCWRKARRRNAIRGINKFLHLIEGDERASAGRAKAAARVRSGWQCRGAISIHRGVTSMVILIVSHREPLQACRQVDRALMRLTRAAPSSTRPQRKKNPLTISSSSSSVPHTALSLRIATTLTLIN